MSGIIGRSPGVPGGGGLVHRLVGRFYGRANALFIRMLECGVNVNVPLSSESLTRSSAIAERPRDA